MTPRWPASEADLAAIVVRWLQGEGWNVYQEVQIHRDGPIADIVATRGPVVWVIETKRTLSLEVIGQAREWQRRRAHQVSVAVPHARNSAGRSMGEAICLRWGIGLLRVRQDGVRVGHIVEPRFNRRARAAELRAKLCEEHRTFAVAGNATSHRWSPWQETCQRVRRAVAAQPGLTLTELLATTEHHYASAASARSALAHWIQAGKLPGVRCERDGRQIRLYPDTAKETSAA